VTVRLFRRSSPLLFLGAIGTGAFLVLVGLSLVQEFRRRYLLEQHIRALRTDIEAREQHIEELRRLKEYLGTDAYVERVAREKLNYQKPGEQVVVVPEQPRPTPTATPAPLQTTRTSSAREWFILFFGTP